MNCPHGNGPPSECSQCLGFPARRIEQIADGMYTIDDEIVDRLPQVRRANYGTIHTATSKVLVRCGYCRKVGHEANNCRERRDNEIVAAHKLGMCSVNTRN